jgi:hypothetical protein
MKGKPSQTLVATLAANAVRSGEPGDRLEVGAEEVVEAVDEPVTAPNCGY